MSNNGYMASVSWVLTSGLGLVLHSSGAVSPATVSLLASAAPSRSVTSSPTASDSHAATRSGGNTRSNAATHCDAPAHHNPSPISEQAD